MGFHFSFPLCLLVSAPGFFGGNREFSCTFFIFQCIIADNQVVKFCGKQGIFQEIDGRIPMGR